MVANLLMSLSRMMLSLVFALPGILMLFPLGLVLQYFAEKERRKALKTSSVKVKATDVMASVKMGICMLLYPIYAFLFTLLFYLFVANFLQLTTLQCIIWVMIFLASFPLITIVSIRSADGVVTHFKDS
mmetsp:Transcript_43096/g.31470  ORF Transcript_43096/g.31470 Transcript_43096/m.31470 type:complete len:129 (+) Transcript_43096:1174-1560(+)